jgi:tagatose-6-phosphate ketose/aldose isomerase
MKYLGIDSTELTKLGGIHTAIEITQQPKLWQKIFDEINFAKPKIANFLEESLANSNRIILTGAGTSAFIGLTLRGIFQQNTGITTEAIATTDIVSHPKDYFIEKVPTILISFARSGNSPESEAAIEMADEICATCYHLIITCNKDGKLAQYHSKPNKFVIILPNESNDQSLAMTSSYTGMLLTGLLIAQIKKLESLKCSLETVIKFASEFIFNYAEDLSNIAKFKFNRVVFLGAGTFYGTATESSLKLQEFTDGEIIGKNDSYLGFRHGPKSVINERTLVVYMISSSNEYAFKYEKDLINSMKKGTSPLIEMSISETPINDFKLPFMFYFTDGEKKLDDEFLALCYILPAQIIGFYKSLELGLQPDTPSVNNDITRVVEGVKIYSII